MNGMLKLSLHPILTCLIAAVWLANGLLCKVLNLAPRHEQIVASILGNTYSREWTVSIGIAEISNSLPYSHQTFDLIVIFLAAHEIRNVKEREEFFKELRRVCKPGGAIYVTEHLRDANNFAAYTIGAFHFYARERWHTCFQQADLTLTKQIRTTPFMTTFVLSPNGNAY